MSNVAALWTCWTVAVCSTTSATTATEHPRRKIDTMLWRRSVRASGSSCSASASISRAERAPLGHAPHLVGLATTTAVILMLAGCGPATPEPAAAPRGDRERAARGDTEPERRAPSRTSPDPALTSERVLGAAATGRSSFCRDDGRRMCVTARTCLDRCGGAVVFSGCCPCPPRSVDAQSCSSPPPEGPGVSAERVFGAP